MQEPTNPKVATFEFLDYRTVYVNFIYSFVWDVTKKSFNDLCVELKPGHSSWTLEKLHERYTDFNGPNKIPFGAYRPTLLVGAQQVLYRTETMIHNLEVIIPLEATWKDDDNKIDEKKIRRRPVSLKYYIRLLENGAGVCTFTVLLGSPYSPDLDKIDQTRLALEMIPTFEDINHVLHLGQNVSFPKSGKHPQVCSYLRINKRSDGTKGTVNLDDQECWVADLLCKRDKLKITKPIQEDTQPTVIEQDENILFTLHQLFNCILTLNDDWFPKSWIMEKPQQSESLWLDWAFSEPEISIRDLCCDEKKGQWQNPYTFTVCILSPEDDLSIKESWLCDHHAKELVALMTKMNLNNETVCRDYSHLSFDYISIALPHNAVKRDSLLNMSHDDRLFFSFSRRGALALTTRPDEIPGYFVLPSFVNLLEILRARWHLGITVNAVLDETLKELVAPERDANSAFEHVFRWRALFSMFLRNPVPFLFDGGAVTEIADRADQEFWLTALGESAHGKLEAIDKLVQYIDLHNVDWANVIK